jgi:hypothetical protein
MYTAVRRTILAAVLVLAALSITTGALAKEPKPAKGTLICFADAPATCSVDPGGQSATLDTSQGGDAGVYKNGTGVSGKPLSQVTFSFDYECTGDPEDCVTGGSPRWSIPIETGKGGPKGTYAFVDANNCGQAALTAGTVNNSCPVSYAPDGEILYPNWAAFAAAHPTYKIGKATTFVIADQPFTGKISNFILQHA